MRLFGHAHHHNDNPLEGASPLDVEMYYMLARIIDNQEIEMSLADDLNNGMTSLATGFGALDAAVQTELAVIAAQPGLSAAVTQAVANISQITGKMATDAAALTASIPAATTVPPPPVLPVPVPVPPMVAVPIIAVPPVTDPSATPPSTPPATATTPAP
jgi:hypothetical protein